MKKIFLLAIFIVSIFASEPVYDDSNNLCYKSRTIMYPKEVVFDALKQTLMASHLNIETVTNKDGVLLAKGAQYNEDEDTVTYVTVSISFKELKKDTTKVILIASYSTSKKKSDTGQVGAAGITLPIPVPFTQKYAIVGSGNISDPLWYQGFFNSLEKTIFEIVMMEHNL
jgi:hypothetical protein